MKFTHSHIAKNYPEILRTQSEEWGRFETALKDEETAVHSIRLAAVAAEKSAAKEIKLLSERLQCATSGAVQLTGGYPGGLIAEEAAATKSYLESKERESAEFLNECVNFKTEKLRASVRDMIPVLDPKSGRAVKIKKSGGLVEWR